MSGANLFIPPKSQVMPAKRSYLFRAGFKGESIALNTAMRTIVNEIYCQGLDLIEPKVSYAVMPFEEVPESIIPGIFTDISCMAIFISSIGERIDAQIQEYIAHQEVLHATLLDAWGSEAVEALNQAFDQNLRGTYGSGTRRFSPGYGDVDIRENSTILNLLQIDWVKVNIETGLILPRKSTACMIGFHNACK